MTYTEIKKQREDDTNRLFSTCGVFWAFSNEQFKEGANKNPLQEGEKYVDIGAGGFIPKHNLGALEQGMKDIEKTFKAQIKEAKAREQHILYELNNHECFYSGDITPALEAMGDDYTREEVEAVMQKIKKITK